MFNLNGARIMKVIAYLERLLSNVERGTMSVDAAMIRFIECYQSDTRPHVQHEIESLVRELEALL